MASQLVARNAAAERISLLKAFLAWKAFLLALVIASSLVPSYDSSTSLALGLPPDHTSLFPSLPNSVSDLIASRLTRWDALYFTSISDRGYVHEQEWAFGPGLPFLVSKVLVPLTFLLGLRLPATPKTAALLSIAVANASHLLAVLLLHALARRLLPRHRTLALTAGLLHVVSPAGVFLSAPYSESLFACLSFAGYLLYLSPELIPAPAPTQRALSLVFSGLLFGLATSCRTNGILNGLVFAVELLASLRDLWLDRGTGSSALSRIRTAFALIVPTVIGGILVTLGSVVPQALAYLRYCSSPDSTGGPRPWCQKIVPSIYAFVQEHYWNTGFLRYWTLPNLPLFLLALPMLAILAVSSYITALQALPTVPSSRASRLLLSMAVSQGLLVFLTLTSYHVQIVTRLSSAYPVWYLWLASALSPPESEHGSPGSKETPDSGPEGSVILPGVSGRRYARAIVKYMVMYASAQGVLFLAFLPPA